MTETAKSLPSPATVSTAPPSAAPPCATPSGQASGSLPSAAELPEADIVLFDGHCRFCKNQVLRLHRFDGRGRLAFMSLHDPEVARRFPDLSHEQLMKEMVVVDARGGRHAGAGAIRYLSRRLPMLWPIMPLLHIPGSMPLWSWLYGQVAKRRYWLAGRIETCDDGACSVHFRR